MSLLEKCNQYTRVEDARSIGLYPYYPPIETSGDGIATVHGRKIIMAGSNNYLGLTHDPRVLDAAADAVRQYGTSGTGSRIMNGNLPLHEILEGEMAEFFGTEGALVFPSGYQANLGVIAGGLLEKGDHIFLDEYVHASQIDAARMSPATLHWFAHNDAADLAAKLAKVTSGSVMVAIDGVYSMDGDIAELPAIAAACTRYGATLLLDDAHGAGVLADGRGTVAYYETELRAAGLEVPLQTITFSKSFASVGGAVLGPERVMNYLRHVSRPMMFTASLAPSNAAAALAALRILRAEPWRCAHVISISHRVHAELTAMGYQAGRSETPVVPVIVHNPEHDDLTNLITVFSAYKRLLELGVYTNPVIPPGATHRLRTAFTAAHTDEHINQVLDAFSVFAGEMGLVGQSVSATA